MDSHILNISHIQAAVGDKQILSDVSLTIKSGEVHALMGPNGSGKSTLSNVIMGHPTYIVTGKKSEISIDNKQIIELPPEERAKAGLFLAFQSPISVPGVSVLNLLRTAFQELYGDKKAVSHSTVQNPVLNRRWSAGGMTIVEFMKRIKEDAKLLRIDDSFLSRGIHDGFSGGEKKKIEMLQALVLQPKFAMFDEIDTGLDVDALKLVPKGIDILSKLCTGILKVNHYQRILKYQQPDVVHILVKGRMVKTGEASLAKEIEDEGYEKYVPISH
jgi:Fe-S cluster assembly ATP-binding protein